MLKKIYFIVLFGILVGFGLVGIASAQSMSMYFTDTDLSKPQGSRVVLELRVDNDEEAWGIEGEIHYDSTVMSFQPKSSPLAPYAGEATRHQKYILRYVK